RALASRTQQSFKDSCRKLRGRRPPGAARGGAMPFSFGRFGRRSGASDALADSGQPRLALWSFKLFHKLALIVALSTLPAMILAALFVTQGRQQMAAAERERQGLAYLSDAWVVFDAAVRQENVDSELARLADAGMRYDEDLQTASYRVALGNAVAAGDGGAIDAGRDFIQRVADNAGLSVDSNLSTLQAITIFTTRIPEVAAAASALVDRADGAGSRIGAIMQFQRSSRLLIASLAATD